MPRSVVDGELLKIRKGQAELQHGLLLKSVLMPWIIVPRREANVRGRPRPEMRYAFGPTGNTRCCGAGDDTAGDACSAFLRAQARYIGLPLDETLQ